MALKKTYAAYLNKHGEWVEQVDVDMHPLEEAEMRAHWAITETLQKVPAKPTLQEEHEMLIEHGADFVKQKREECEKAIQSAQPEIEAAKEAYNKAKSAWDEHAMLCHANKMNPDTFEGNAKDSLPPPLPLNYPEEMENAVKEIV